MTVFSLPHINYMSEGTIKESLFHLTYTPKENMSQKHDSSDT